MENFETKEQATDMEMALILAKHIDNPCEDEQGNNIKDFYIREAKKVLETMQNPDAKKILENAINEH